jgi:hypothetical protein
MSSPQERYAESLKKSQEALQQSQKAVVDAMQAWTKSASSAYKTPASSLPGQPNASQVIDQVFDFAEQMLKVQRQFAKNVAAAAPAAPTPESAE